MNTVRNVVLADLIAGTLLASVAPALATDREWGHQNQRYRNHGGLGGDYARLERARAKLSYAIG